MTINDEFKKEFEEQLKKFKANKSHGIITDLSYAINQIHNLYYMINDISKDEFEKIWKKEVSNAVKFTEENNNEPAPVENIEEINNSKIEEVSEDADESIIDKILNGENVDFTVDPSLEGIEDKSVSDIVKEELANWGLNTEYVACKYILELVEIAEKADIKPDDSYEDICKKAVEFCPSVPNEAQFKRSITFIKNKADFSKADYLSILKVLDRKSIDNKVILKNIIELCY